MAKLQIGDIAPSACTQVDALPLRPLKKDADNANTIQFLIPVPANFLHHSPLASLESSDPLAGMQKVFNDGGLKVCNTIDGGHPTPWGKRHTPFHLYVGGCRPVNIDINWVSFQLDFGDTESIPGKLLENHEPPFIIWGDPLYIFKFRNARGIAANPSILPTLFVIVELQWFDENFTDGDPDGLNEGIWFTDSRPMLTSENDSVTIQARVRSSAHLKNNPVVSTNDFVPKEWVTQRVITCQEANDVLGMNESGEELETWTILGNNAGIALDNEGADPALAPDGFSFTLNIVLQYAIA